MSEASPAGSETVSSPQQGAEGSENNENNNTQDNVNNSNTEKEEMIAQEKWRFDVFETFKKILSQERPLFSPEAVKILEKKEGMEIFLSFFTRHSSFFQSHRMNGETFFNVVLDGEVSEESKKPDNAPQTTSSTSAESASQTSATVTENNIPETQSKPETTPEAATNESTASTTVSSEQPASPRSKAKPSLQKLIIIPKVSQSEELPLLSENQGTKYISSPIPNFDKNADPFSRKNTAPASPTITVAPAISPMGTSLFLAEDSWNQLLLEDTKMSFKVTEILSKPLSFAVPGNLIADSTEQILCFVFEKGFEKNSLMNGYHFMRLLDHYMKNFRGRTFEVIRQHGYMDVLLKNIEKDPIPNCINNLVTSFKLTPLPPNLKQNASLAQKFKQANQLKFAFQQHLAQSNFLLRIIKQAIHYAPTDSSLCERYSDLFIEIFDELCLQHNSFHDDQVHSLLLTLIYQSHVLTDYRWSSKSNSLPMPLSKLIASAHRPSKSFSNGQTEDESPTGSFSDYITEMCNVIVNPEASYHSRLTLARILLYLIERTAGMKNCSTKKLESTIKKETMPDIDFNETIPNTLKSDNSIFELRQTPFTLSMREFNQEFMRQIKEQFDVLCKAVVKDYKLYKSKPEDQLKLSAYSVTRQFTILRLTLIQLIYHIARYDFQEIVADKRTRSSDDSSSESSGEESDASHSSSDSSASDESSEGEADEDVGSFNTFKTAYSEKPPKRISLIGQHISNNTVDIMEALIEWFFEYRYNNLFHHVFTYLMCDIIQHGESHICGPCIMSEHKFLSRLIHVYQEDKLQRDNRGHMLHIFNFIRLYYQTISRKNYYYQFLKGHQLWAQFQDQLLQDSLLEIKSQSVDDIQLGSEYAHNFGFEAHHLHKEKLSKKSKRKARKKRHRKRKLAKQALKELQQQSQGSSPVLSPSKTPAPEKEPEDTLEISKQN